MFDLDNPGKQEMNLVNNFENDNSEVEEENIEDVSKNEIDIFSNIGNSLIQNQNDSEVNLLPGEELEISELPELSDDLEGLTD